jgi:hypothetical protein
MSEAKKEEIKKLAKDYIEDWHRDLPPYVANIPLFGHIFRIKEIYRDALTLKYVGPSRRTLRRNEHDGSY